MALPQPPSPLHVVRQAPTRQRESHRQCKELDGQGNASVGEQRGQEERVGQEPQGMWGALSLFSSWSVSLCVCVPV